MNALSPITETTKGLRVYIKGVNWLKQHPKYLFVVFVPMIISIILVGFLYGLFLSYDEWVFAMILFDKPEAWWALGIYYILKFLLYIVFFVLGMVSCYLLANIIASPIYEYVSLAVESQVTGKPAPDISLMESLKLIGEELKKVLFILGVSILLLFIPILNVISILVTAFLVGWDQFDYPLARRGWGFGERLGFVFKNGWSVMGLGLWLMIPFVQILLAPLAVVGGTLLCIEALKNHEDKGVLHAKS